MKKYLSLFLILFALCGFNWVEDFTLECTEEKCPGISKTLECTADKCPGSSYELAMSPVFLGGGGAGAAGCNASTDYVGNKAEYSTARSITAGYMYCWAFTPTCSGTTTAAYIYHQGTTSQTVGIAIYSKSGSSPVIGDLRLATTGNDAISSSTDKDWATAAMSEYSVDSATAYWVCAQTDGQFDLYTTTGNSDRYEPTATALPSNLTGTWGGPTDDRVTSIYISIGG